MSQVHQVNRLKKLSLSLIAAALGILCIYQISPYRLDSETFIFEHNLDEQAHSFVRSVHLELGESYGASYTANGVILIWSFQPFAIVHEVPFATHENVKLTWQGETLSIDTDTLHYTFSTEKGLSQARSRNMPLEPNYEIFDESEVARLKIPKNYRTYQQKDGVIYGLLSDGSLFKQSGLTRELIPSSKTKTHLMWSQQGVLIAENEKNDFNAASHFHWFPSHSNRRQSTWTDKSFRSIYWNPEFTGFNFLMKSHMNFSLTAGTFLPQNGHLQPVATSVEGWKQICPPRVSSQSLKSANTPKTAERIIGTNQDREFLSTNADASQAKILMSLKFENIVCAENYAVGLVNQQGTSKLFLITLDDLSVEPYPFDLDLYLSMSHLALNNKKHLGLSMRKGFYILSPTASPIHVPIKAWTATSSPDDSQWLVSTIDGGMLFVDDQGNMKNIFGPRGVDQLAWPHPRVITWSGWNAGMLIAPSSGDFHSSKTKIIYYRPDLQAFEYPKGYIHSTQDQDKTTPDIIKLADLL